MEEGSNLVSHICVTCGTEFKTSAAPPQACPICEDERQFVAPNGQRWTTLAELQKSHRNLLFEEDQNLWGVQIQPQFAIGQRALYLQTERGGFLWDCVSLIDQSTIRLIQRLGG
jgi:hypothetical protein